LPREKMEKTKKPGKQRKRIFAAELHKLQKLMRARLSKQLRKALKRRSIALRKGDKVRVAKGKYKKTEGKITAVDRKRGRIFIDALKRKKVSGKEILIPIRANHVIAIELDSSDARRLGAKKTLLKEKK